MKKKIRIALSLALCLCMLLGLIPFAAVADDPAPAVKDYDAAENGEVLYTVDFSGEDGVFDTSYSGMAADSTVQVGLSGTNNAILTFSGKTEAKADFYGGYLFDFPITDHVYTVSWFVVNPDLVNIRQNIQLYHSGTRVGIGNVKESSTTKNQMTVVSNGSVGENLATMYQPNTQDQVGAFERFVDTENGDRQYFKAVVDGVNYVCNWYAMNTAKEYQLIGTTRIFPMATRNYLAIGMYSWDPTTVSGVDKPISFGNVTVAKGAEIAATPIINGTTAYTTLYDSKANGDVLYSIPFNSNDVVTWGSYRATTSVTSITADTLTLNKADPNPDDTTTGEVQCLTAYMPNAAEMGEYGNFTYEFFVKSDKRTGLEVFGYRSGGTYGGAGFTYFNSNASLQGLVAGGFVAMGAGNLNNAAGYRLTSVSYVQKQNPDTADETKPNVKIEVDVVARTLTNWLLIDGVWTKTAMITYTSSSGVPMLYFHAFDYSTNAVYKNLVIKKGLTASGTPETYVRFKLDGKYADTKGYQNASSVKLPTPENKLFNIASLTDAEGNDVTSVSDLTLTAGVLNLVELKTKYTPVPEPVGLEIRAVQTSTKVGETTSVRFIGTIDALRYAQAGFLVTVKWKDAEGVVHAGTKTVDKSTATVYSSVLAASGDGYETVTAASMGLRYLVALSIDEVPIGDGVQVDFTLTPYTLALGQTPAADRSNYTLYPDNEKTCSFVNGVYTPAAVPLE